MINSEHKKNLTAKYIISFLLAFVYSVLYTIIGPMVKIQSLQFDRKCIIPFLVWLIIGTVFNLLVFCFIPQKEEKIKKAHFYALAKKANDKSTALLDKLGNKRLLLFVWLIIFLAWVPVYLMVYPGVLAYDILSQTASAMGEITTNHHPVLHTWLIRVFMRFGNKALGGYEYGIGVFSLIQMIILSYSLARLVVLLKKKKVPGLLVIIVAIGSALWFENAILSVTMTKDIMHSAFLVLFLCHYVEIVMNPSEYAARKINLVMFPIVSFFMCAFRNNGLHILIFCFAILGLLRIKKIRNIKKYLILILVIILPVVMFKVYSGPVFKALGIAQGEVREALCVPIQQLQRTAINRADELSDEQTYYMDYYIDNLSWRDWGNKREYNPFIADPAKSCFYSGHYEESPLTFWKFYIKTGIQFPKDYLAAFLSNTIGYWYPGGYDYSFVEFGNYSSGSFVVPLERKSIIKWEPITNLYKSFCTSSTWRNIYVIRLFFAPGFSAWILLYSIIIAWKDKKFFTRELPIFLPLIAQFGIMMLAPMASFRYSWPLYLMFPVILIAFKMKKSLIE